MIWLAHSSLDVHQKLILQGSASASASAPPQPPSAPQTLDFRLARLGPPEPPDCLQHDHATNHHHITSTTLLSLLPFSSSIRHHLPSESSSHFILAIAIAIAFAIAFFSLSFLIPAHHELATIRKSTYHPAKPRHVPFSKSSESNQDDSDANKESTGIRER